MLNLFNIGKNLTYTMDANISDVIKSKDETSLKLTRSISQVQDTEYSCGWSFVSQIELQFSMCKATLSVIYFIAT